LKESVESICGLHAFPTRHWQQMHQNIKGKFIYRIHTTPTSMSCTIEWLIIYILLITISASSRVIPLWCQSCYWKKSWTFTVVMD